MHCARDPTGKVADNIIMCRQEPDGNSKGQPEETVTTSRKWSDLKAYSTAVRGRKNSQSADEPAVPIRHRQTLSAITRRIWRAIAAERDRLSLVSCTRCS
eukprot:3504280-Pleurochrysis_carterae.AAC.1